MAKSKENLNKILTGYFVKYRSLNLSSFLYNVEKDPGGSGSLERKVTIRSLDPFSLNRKERHKFHSKLATIECYYH